MNIQWTDDYRTYETLPDDAKIKFRLDVGVIEIKLRDGFLFVTCDGQLAVMPKASNNIIIGLFEL